MSRLALALLLVSSSAFAQTADTPPSPPPSPPAPAPDPTPPAPAPSAPEAAPALVPAPAPAPVVEPPKPEHTLSEADLHAKSGEEAKPTVKPIDLKPGGYVQADTRSFATDTGTHDLTLRRLRFKLDGKAFKYFKVYALVDTAQSKLVVQNAYVELSPRDEFGIRVG